MQISRSGRSSGAARTAVSGNGAVYHNNGQLLGREHYAVEPLRWTDPDGIGGPPRLEVQPGYLQLGALLGADGTLTTDQLIEIKGAHEYIIDKIVLCRSTAMPGAMAGGIYTRNAKAGVAILPAGQVYTGLTGDPWSVVTLSPAEALRAAPYLYLSLTTPNAAPITFDVLVFGRVIRALEV